MPRKGHTPKRDVLADPIYNSKVVTKPTLTEQDNRGRENFTVMHEVFHHVLHKRCFKDMGKNFVHTTYSRTIDGKINCYDFGLKQIEYQANACAAAFLMPAKLTIAEYKRRYEEAGFDLSIMKAK